MLTSSIVDDRRPLRAGLVLAALLALIGALGIAVPAQAQIGGSTLTLTSPASYISGGQPGCPSSITGQPGVPVVCVPAGTAGLTLQWASAGFIANGTVAWTAVNRAGNGSITSPAPSPASGTAALVNGVATFTFVGGSTALNNFVIVNTTYSETGANSALAIVYSQGSSSITLSSTSGYTGVVGGATTIAGTVVNSFGQPVSGATVTGSVTVGPNQGAQLSTVTTGANGQFSIGYTGPSATPAYFTDTVQVTATVPNAAAATANTYVVWSATVSSATLSNLTVNGVAAANFTTGLTVPSAGTLQPGVTYVPVSVTTSGAASAVTFSASQGGLVLNPGGTIANARPSLSVVGANNTATVWWASTQTGTGTLTVSAGNSLSASVAFATSAAAARNVILSPPPAQINAGGTVSLTATVTDGFGNPVPAGVSVNFAISSAAGQFSNGSKSISAATNSAGQAVAVLETANNDSGTVTVAATGTGGQFGLPAGNPVSLMPASLASASATIAIGASAQPRVSAPSQVRPGARFRVQVSGFAANSRVTLFIANDNSNQNAVRTTVRVNNSGAGAVNVQVRRAGTYEIDAEGPSGIPYATRSLRVR